MPGLLRFRRIGNHAVAQNGYSDQVRYLASGPADIVNSFAIPVLSLLLGTCPALCAASPPLSPEQAKILDSVRASALQYTNKLPDFMCTQITHRQVSPVGTFASSLTGISGRGAVAGLADMASSNPDLGDVIEERLTFIDQKENYTVLTVNGRKVTGLDPMRFQGAVSAGEFGSDLRNIFDPGSATAFAWDRSGAVHGRSVYIYSFHVPAQHGAVVFDRGSGRRVVAPYAGRIFVDTATLGVLRIEDRLDLPADFPIRDASITIEYKPIAIAGRSYMLPFRSELRMQDPSRQYINSIDFRNYQKFVVESTVLYGTANPH
jgi:hypothetical protein